MRKRRKLENAHSFLLGHAYVQMGGEIISEATHYGYNRGSRHTCYDETHKGPPYTTGGPLRVSHFVDGQKAANIGNYQVGIRHYDGGFACSQQILNFLPDFDDYIADSNSFQGLDLDAWGATAWNRFRPGQPSADLGTFIGELRDMPRMLKTTANIFNKEWRKMTMSSRKAFAKDASNHWLNLNFGWIPFVSDLFKYFKVLSNLDKQINQLIRDNDRWVRRSGVVRTSEERTVIGGKTATTAHTPILSTPFFFPAVSTTGAYETYFSKTENVWFSGKFKYHVSDASHLLTSKPQFALRSLGLLPTPGTVWNLIPWSWLVDWGSNVGDVLSNLSTGLADRLIAKYAYVMGTTDYTTSVDSFLGLNAEAGGPQHATWSYTAALKERKVASPFGFNVSSGDLSGKQKSILTALAISRFW